MLLLSFLLLLLLLLSGVYAFADFLPRNFLPLRLQLQLLVPHASVKFAVNHKRHKNKTPTTTAGSEEREEGEGGTERKELQKRKYRKEVPAITDANDAWNTT